MPDDQTPRKLSGNIFPENMEGKSFSHVHFIDTNGMGQIYEGFDFSSCVFIRSYFRDAKFIDCNFTGAHFIDCNFRGAEIRSTDFDYASFSGTRIATNEILNNLPPYPNVRRELLQVLRHNAMSLGDYLSEKIFVVHEIDARKEHYRGAWKQADRYYKNKYPGWKSWLKGIKLLGLKIDWLIWGHGEKIWQAPISLIALLFLLALCMTAKALGLSEEAKVSDTFPLFLNSFEYLFDLFLGRANGYEGLVVAWIERLVLVLRYIAFGMVVAALYRLLSHR